MRLEQQKRKKESKVLKAFKRLMFMILLLLFILVSSLFGFGVGMFIEQKNYVESIGKIEIPEATFFYAVNDDPATGTNVVLAKIYKENRTNVKLKDVPQNLQNAVIAIEDKRFYEHNGVDLRGIARAMVQNFKTSSYSQGASTISMQLARNVKLNAKKTLSRKIQEVIIAAQIEQTMSKEEILEAYLNSIYLGSGAFGVETAAQVYYGKHVSEVNLAEAALIAGLPKAPSTYDPHKHYDAAIKRRNVVLQAMYEEGFISKNDYDKARNQKTKIKPKSQGNAINKYPHITNTILEELKKRFDEEQIYSGGLRVYTTIDTRIQDAADKAVRSRMGAAHRRNPGLECALIGMDPSTGYILAMCGSIDPNSEFNRCTQAKRQPGSVFKPVVYYTAMEKLGWGPETTISNAPFSQGSWHPKNFDGHYGGTPSMRVAIYNSINLPAIRAGQRAGMENVCAMAKRLGIDSELPPYLSTCIGAGNIKLVEMLQVFNVTANEGRIFTPTVIKRVYDTSKSNCLVDNTKRTGKRVISARLANTMDSLLRGVVTSGTGRPVSYVANARGKTGTNGKTDVSFAGYVPDGLSAMVWIGNDHFKNIPYSYSGGGTCGPIWAGFIRAATPYFQEDRKKEKEQKEKEQKALKQAQREKELEKRSEEQEPKEEMGQVVNNTETENTTQDDDEGFDVDARDKSEPTPDAYVDDSDDDDLIYVDVCPASNKLPNPNCPSSVLKKFKMDKAPDTVCDIH